MQRIKRTIGLIGGDRRQAELSRLLAESGHMVCTYGLNEWKALGDGPLDRVISSEAVILPLPLCRGDGVLNCQEDPMPTAELFRRLTPEQRILAGQVLPQQYREAKDRGLLLEDYFLREELTVANAAATAEAAVQTAMDRLDRTLLGMRCLVLGFGRIGKLLSLRLQGVGARVTAAARKPADMAWIRALGLDALDIGQLDGHLSEFGTVFNTVPAMVLPSGLLAQLPWDCLCVDLASARGIDLLAAEALGLSGVWAKSLPGRLAPRTAAAIIRDAVCAMLDQEPAP